MAQAALWQRYRQLLPFDFIGTSWHTKKALVQGRDTGLRIYWGGGGWVPSMRFPAGETFYLMFVATPHGNLRLEVSKPVFDLIRAGDSIIVCYQQGRWTGELRGGIAQ